MEQAAKIFKDVFGDASAEYRDLIEHLARSYHHGSPEQWRRHAEAIRASLGKDAAGNFDVKTSSADGMEHLESTQTVENAALLHQAALLFINNQLWTFVCFRVCLHVEQRRQGRQRNYQKDRHDETYAHLASASFPE